MQRRLISIIFLLSVSSLALANSHEELIRGLKTNPQIDKRISKVKGYVEFVGNQRKVHAQKKKNTDELRYFIALSRNLDTLKIDSFAPKKCDGIYTALKFGNTSQISPDQPKTLEYEQTLEILDILCQKN